MRRRSGSGSRMELRASRPRDAQMLLRRLKGGPPADERRIAGAVRAAGSLQATP